jgi:predicted RNA-binding protein associated with RNAse of E/G family
MHVNLIKPHKHTTISYVATPLAVTSSYACVRAVWTRPAVNLGYMQFAPGDILDEHFYADAWYCIFAVFRPDGQLRGWYCNVTKPAIITPTAITSIDLELDLFVAPDRIATLRLDIDEFEAQQYQQHNPQVYDAGYVALEALERMARAHQPPFDRIEMI